MNIYVGNLPYSVTDEQLKSIFEEYGTVSSANVIFDRQTNRSKGFGFVEMENDSEAQEAINKLNETELSGRNIRVNQAKPREDRPRGGSRHHSDY